MLYLGVPDSMHIALRNYQGPADLELQHAFWVTATRKLPWCWKPTVSPRLYADGPQFDPRSRSFAFEGDRLAGYMSFTGQGEFVSLGYPWVLPGYEGELQESLWDAVYGFAAGPEYGGKTFAQRFRRAWTAQIDFFKRHGFAESHTSAINALDLRGGLRAQPCRYSVEIQQQFRWEEFARLAAWRLPAEQSGMFKHYFQSVDFDFAIRATQGDAAVAYLGVALRADTGFSEVIAAAVDDKAADAIGPCLGAAADESRARGASWLGTKPIAGDDAGRILTNIGFRQVTEEVLLSKRV